MCEKGIVNFLSNKRLTKKNFPPVRVCVCVGVGVGVFSSAADQPKKHLCIILGIQWQSCQWLVVFVSQQPAASLYIYKYDIWDVCLTGRGLFHSSSNRAGRGGTLILQPTHPLCNPSRFRQNVFSIYRVWRFIFVALTLTAFIKNAWTVY